MTQDDFGWLKTKVKDSKLHRMTQDSTRHSLNESLWVYIIQVYRYSSLLRSVGSWILDILWLGDILERDHHTVGGGRLLSTNHRTTQTSVLLHFFSIPAIIKNSTCPSINSFYSYNYSELNCHSQFGLQQSLVVGQPYHNQYNIHSNGVCENWSVNMWKGCEIVTNEGHLQYWEYKIWHDLSFFSKTDVQFFIGLRCTNLNM